jgi:hypothetical protein
VQTINHRFLPQVLVNRTPLGHLLGQDPQSKSAIFFAKELQSAARGDLVLTESKAELIGKAPC